MPIDLPQGVKPLVLTPEKLEKLWAQFNSIPGIFDDYSKGNYKLFLQRFADPNSFWVETVDEVGILYATEVRPGLSANCHFTFFDSILRGREELVLSCLRWLCNVANLRKINVWIPDFARVLGRFLGRIGFREEGTIRRWSFSKGRLFDIIAYGITNEEVFDGRVFSAGEGSTSPDAGVTLDR